MILLSDAFSVVVGKTLRLVFIVSPIYLKKKKLVIWGLKGQEF